MAGRKRARSTPQQEQVHQSKSDLAIESDRSRDNSVTAAALLVGDSVRDDGKPRVPPHFKALLILAQEHRPGGVFGQVSDAIREGGRVLAQRAVTGFGIFPRVSSQRKLPALILRTPHIATHLGLNPR
jgi:hypothetical protein